MVVWYIMYFFYIFIFFFKQKTAYEMRISDWSSDVCSSDLPAPTVGGEGGGDGDAEFILRAAGNPAAEFEAAAGEGIEHVEAAARGAQPRKGVDAAVVAGQDGKLGAAIGSGIAPGGAAAIVAELGREACRENVGQSVVLSVVDVKLKKKI